MTVFQGDTTWIPALHFLFRSKLDLQGFYSLLHVWRSRDAVTCQEEGLSSCSESQVPKVLWILHSPQTAPQSPVLHVLWIRPFMFVSLIHQAMTLPSVPLDSVSLHWFSKNEHCVHCVLKMNSNTPGPRFGFLSLFKQNGWKMVWYWFICCFDLDCFSFPKISRVLFKNLLKQHPGAT